MDGKKTMTTNKICSDIIKVYGKEFRNYILERNIEIREFKDFEVISLLDSYLYEIIAYNKDKNESTRN